MKAMRKATTQLIEKVASTSERRVVLHRTQRHCAGS